MSFDTEFSRTDHNLAEAGDKRGVTAILQILARDLAACRLESSALGRENAKLRRENTKLQASVSTRGVPSTARADELTRGPWSLPSTVQRGDPARCSRCGLTLEPAAPRGSPVLASASRCPHCDGPPVTRALDSDPTESSCDPSVYLG